MSFTYRGEARLVELYEHGLTKAGLEIVLGFQRSGGSNSHRSTGWKTFSVERLIDPAIVEVAFMPSRTDYSPGSPEIRVRHCTIRLK